MKEKIRENYMLQRSGVSSSRRKEAKEKVTALLLEMIEGFEHVLSYQPLSDEVDVSEFNSYLSVLKRLSLPRISSSSLVPYEVTDVENQLKTFSHRILEPDFSCKESEAIDIVIVPGVVFDKNGGRVGFGKGHYDKYLNKTKLPTIGVCFKEQLFEGKLPLESHDIPMERLCIV